MPMARISRVTGRRLNDAAQSGQSVPIDEDDTEHDVVQQTLFLGE